jgi:hypothetical protein
LFSALREVYGPGEWHAQFSSPEWHQHEQQMQKHVSNGRQWVFFDWKASQEHQEGHGGLENEDSP